MQTDYYVGKLDFKKNVRLLLLTPVTPDDGNEGPIPLLQQEYLLPTTRVDELYCNGAPQFLSNSEDSLKAVPLIVAKSQQAELEGYDVVIINCMLDPGLKESKCAVNIPVIGLKETTLAIATLIGNNPATIYPQCIPVLKLADDESKTMYELVKAGRKQIAENRADILIPNCGYLGELAQQLQAELNVPVLPNRVLALKLAEMLAIFKIRQNQENYKPEKKSKLYRIASFIYHRLKKYY